MYHDISAEGVKLDYQTLRKTAIFAVRYSKEAIEKLDREIADKAFRGNYSGAACYSQWLLEATEAYHIALNTYHALLELPSRESCEIVAVHKEE